MSQANAEVVRRMFNAGNRRDVPTLEGRISEDCELHSVLAATEGRVFRERQGIRDYFAELGSAFAEFQYEIEKVMDTGEDRVVALVKFTARGKASGVILEQPFGLVVGFQGEEISRMESYLNQPEALDAVGLRE